MKKPIQTILLIFLAVTTLIFGYLWQREKSSKDDLRLLAQAGAADAYSEFVQYQENGQVSSYWEGVANFRSFEQAYYLLTENTNKNGNYTFCNEVYGALVVHPDKCQKYITDIISAMDILAHDVEDGSGYVKMEELRNTLQYE